MRVLYVNHTAAVSGGERSLLTLLAALGARVQPCVATPPGALEQAVERLGVPVRPITGTAGSLRLHPLHTPVALAQMARAAGQVRRAARAHRADVVHANSIRAGLILALARPDAATVAHVRDCLPDSRTSRLTMRLLASGATTVVANSHYTAANVRALAPHARIEVVHNSVDVAVWDPGRLDRELARAKLGEAVAGRLLLGVVAQLTPWKGQDTAIETLRLLCEQGVDAHLLLVGSAKFVARATRFDNQGYVRGLWERSEEAGLQERVSWLGEREDVPEVVRALDVLLAPSLEEPFGRSLIEAMALEVPVLATNVGGPAEIVQDGVEGYLLPPSDPAAWASAVRRVTESADGGRAMGRAGRERVQREFTTEVHREAMLAVYARALAAAKRA